MPSLAAAQKAAGSQSQADFEAATCPENGADDNSHTSDDSSDTDDDGLDEAAPAGHTQNAHPSSTLSSYSQMMTDFTPSLLEFSSAGRMAPPDWHWEWKLPPHDLFLRLRDLTPTEIKAFAKKRACSHCVDSPGNAVDNITMEFIRLRGGVTLPDVTHVVPGLAALSIADARDTVLKLCSEVWAPPSGTPRPATSTTSQAPLFQRFKDMPDGTATTFARALGLPTVHAQWFLGSAMVDLCRTLTVQAREHAAATPIADAVSSIHAAAGGAWDPLQFLRPPPPPNPGSQSHANTTWAQTAARAAPKQASCPLFATPAARLILATDTDDPSPLTHLAGIASRLPGSISRSALLLVQQLYLPNDGTVHDGQGECPLVLPRCEAADVEVWKGWQLLASGDGRRSRDVQQVLDESWRLAFLSTPHTTPFPVLILSDAVTPASLDGWNGIRVGDLWPSLNMAALTQALKPLLSLCRLDLSVRGVTMDEVRAVHDIGLQDSPEFWAGVAGSVMGLSALLEANTRSHRASVAGLAGLLLVAALNCHAQAADYALDRSDSGLEAGHGAEQRFLLRVQRKWLHHLALKGTILCSLTQDQLRDAWDASHVRAETPSQQPTRRLTAADFATCGYCQKYQRSATHGLLQCYAAGRALQQVQRQGGNVRAFVGQLLRDHSDARGLNCAADALDAEVDGATAALLQVTGQKQAASTPHQASGASPRAPFPGRTAPLPSAAAGAGGGSSAASL